MHNNAKAQPATPTSRRHAAPPACQHLHGKRTQHRTCSAAVRIHFAYSIRCTNFTVIGRQSLRSVFQKLYTRKIAVNCHSQRPTGRNTNQKTRRHPDKQRYSQTDRQADRKTDRQPDRQTERQERHTDRRDRQTDRQTGRQINRQASKQTKQISKQAGRNRNK